jgi:hypothetical protein
VRKEIRQVEWGNMQICTGVKGVVSCVCVFGFGSAAVSFVAALAFQDPPGMLIFPATCSPVPSSLLAFSATWKAPAMQL